MADQTPQDNEAQPAQPVQPVEAIAQEPAVQAQVTGQPVNPPQPQQGTQAVPPSPYTDGAPVMPGSAGAPANTEGEGKGTASLVMGILSIVFNAPPVGLVLGILAIVFGRKSKKLTPPGMSTGKATGGIVTGVIGIVLSIICTITLVVMIVGGALLLSDPDVQKSLSEMDATSSYALDSSQNDAAQAAAEAALEKACNPDAATIAKLSSELDQSFSASAGYSLSELGISPEELTTWLMTGASYKVEDTYAYADSATVSAVVNVRDSLEFLDLWEDDLSTWMQSSEYASMTDPAAVKAKAGELMRGAMDKTPMSDTYAYVEVTKTNGEWTVSEDDQDFLLTQIYTL